MPTPPCVKIAFLFLLSLLKSIYLYPETCIVWSLLKCVSVKQRMSGLILTIISVRRLEFN